MSESRSGIEASIAEDIDAYLQRHKQKSLLRFITCGSVDDGKSTLIGRLLYDSKMIFEDQLSTLVSDSKRFGTQGRDIDFALLVDGLAAEREQGITIDVAYRFFTTEKRKFIVADAPGHEQYTRNLVTGASTCDLAIMLVDAQKGILTQTRRHTYLASLLGIRKFVLAVNKMDIVGYQQSVFEEIVQDYEKFLNDIGVESVTSIPVSALAGDNVLVSSDNTNWYQGPALLPYLETVVLDNDDTAKLPFEMPVQWVNRPNMDFRGFAGSIATGEVCPGDPVRILPSNKTSEVKRIVSFDGDLDRAFAGQSVTLTLRDEVDCSRGQVIVAATSELGVAAQFETTIVWMDEEELIQGRGYWMKIGANTVTAAVQALKYEVDVNTQQHFAAKTLAMNAIGVANVITDQDIPFAPYTKSRDLGGFILIDKVTNKTVAAGMIHFALRRATNITWHASTVTREDRAKIKGQKPLVIWMTGLSGSGKSTIANCLETKLAAMGRHTFLLDGDNVRHGLNKDLGFQGPDRIENIRRVGEVAKLMMEAGLIVITAFISPFRAERELVRAMMGPDEFFEVFVDTPLEVAESRDVKGLYAKARAGQIRNFTGIDSPYEAPETCEIKIDTAKYSPEQAADLIIKNII